MKEPNSPKDFREYVTLSDIASNMKTTTKEILAAADIVGVTGIKKRHPLSSCGVIPTWYHKLDVQKIENHIQQKRHNKTHWTPFKMNAEHIKRNQHKACKGKGPQMRASAIAGQAHKERAENLSYEDCRAIEARRRDQAMLDRLFEKYGEDFLEELL